LIVCLFWGSTCFVVVGIVVCLLFELGDCFSFLAGNFEGAECPN
jgi:hypothetical protein